MSLAALDKHENRTLYQACQKQPLAAVLVAWARYAWFQKAKKRFADVL